MIGKTLAHYQVTEKIGEGGMGEVYRARDTKLDRDVALKILPREMSGDRERSARFEREARTLASLQHPNIASIYGYEDVEGVRFLAMELVEGEDLAERLEQGAISQGEALSIALQVAVGLEAAHERNIVHRDLKPANVKVGNDGVVKILDFGLARAYTGDPDDESNPALSPTITAAMTQAGTILGTAAYMSPEQARGRPVDKRSDIWAFGVMTYEMLTGTRLYSGETITDILGAIVHSEPDLNLLPKSVPASVRALLGRCLTGNVQERLRDIGEARIALMHPHDAPAQATSTSAASRTPRWMVAALALLVVAVTGGALMWPASPPPPRVIQASVTIPADLSIVATGLRGGSLRVSPDGDAVICVVQTGRGQQIWMRNLAERDGRFVQGTEGGHRPFWSPDGRSIGFFAHGNLRRVAITGGAPLTIATAPNGRGGAWLDNGLIVYAPTPNSEILAVPAGGGQPRSITEPGARSHREPRPLGKGSRFLFLEQGGGGGQWTVYVGSTDGMEPVQLATSTSSAEYASGHLLYMQGRTLVAQPLDLDGPKLFGDPVPLAEQVIRDTNFGIGVFSASSNGVLCFQQGTREGSQLVWMDRAGKDLFVHKERTDYAEIALSADGRMIAGVIEDVDGGSDIWLIDVEQDTRRRFTFTPDNAGMRRNEVKWSTDGSFLVYAVEYDGKNSLYTKAIDGRTDEKLLLEHPEASFWPYDISPDDKWVLYGHQSASGGEDLWIVPSDGDGEPRALFETPYDEWPGSISPDGRWLAFDSDETGRREVFVMPFPEGTGRWQVSRDGGRFPHWNAAGDELYYVNSGGGLSAATVDGEGDVFHSTPPVELLDTGFDSGAYGLYDVHPSGDRFLLVRQGAQSAPISLFTNWERALDAR